MTETTTSARSYDLVGNFSGPFQSDVDVDGLRQVAVEYRSPEPEQVQTLRKRTKSGYVDLRYTSHATVTQILNEIDPLWQFEFIGERGIPHVIEKNGMLTAFGHLTLLGKKILAVGSCDDDKADWAKELYGDCLRNGAMRAGIHIALWEKDFPEAEAKKRAAKKEEFDASIAKAREAIVREDSRSSVDEDPLKAAVDAVTETLGATLATPPCGTQPERFASWEAVPGCGKQVEAWDDRVVRITKTYLCDECLARWRASTGAKEE